MLFFEASFSQWQKVNGPFGGNGQKIAFRDSVLYLTTFQSGLFFSADSGHTWEQRMKGVDWFSVYDVAISDSLVFIGTVGGVYSSNDQGITWTHSNSNQNATADLEFFNSDTILCAGVGGVLLSGNYGNTWNDISSNLPRTGTNSDKVFNIGRRIFASNSSQTFFYSDNLGLVWDSIPGLQGVNASLFNYGNIIYARADSLLYNSLDTGATWSNISMAGISGTLNPVICGADDSTLYIKNNEHVYFKKSSDLIWTEIYDLYMKSIYSIVYFNAEKIATNPMEGVLRCNVNDTVWNVSNVGFTGLTVNKILEANGELFAACADWGLYHSSDFGNTWIKATNGLPDDNYISLTNSDSVIFCGTENYGVFSSSDMGNSWTSASSGISFPGMIVDLLSFDSNVYATNGNDLYFTSNNGLSWDSILSGSVYALAHNSNTLFVGIYGSTNDFIFSTTDNGLNWNTVFNSSSVSASAWGIVDISTFQDSVLFASIITGIVRSFDYGSTWNYCTPVGWGTVSMLEYNNEIIAGFTGDLHTMSIYDNSWMNLTPDLPFLYAQSLLVKDDTLYMATFGSGIYKASIADLSVGVNTQSLNESESYLFYPNPILAGNKLNIKLNDHKQKFNISIIDIAGRILFSENIIILSDELVLDYTFEMEGMYFIKVTTEDSANIFKVIVQ